MAILDRKLAFAQRQHFAGDQRLERQTVIHLRSESVGTEADQTYSITSVKGAGKGGLWLDRDLQLHACPHFHTIRSRRLSRCRRSHCQGTFTEPHGWCWNDHGTGCA